LTASSPSDFLRAELSWRRFVRSAQLYRGLLKAQGKGDTNLEAFKGKYMVS
jgi:hypothetical protein